MAAAAQIGIGAYRRRGDRAAGSGTAGRDDRRRGTADPAGRLGCLPWAGRTPRQFAVALGDLGTSRWNLTPRDREILLGCAAGAGLAAVYSVPAGGALFALQVVLRTWNPGCGHGTG